MCVAVPVEVLEIQGREAVVQMGGVRTRVNIDLVADLQVGEYVLLHAGCAMQKIDKEEAEKTIKLFKELDELEEK